MTENNVNSIPTSDLIVWYEEERGRFIHLQKKLNEMQARPDQNQSSLTDTERIAGQIQGRAEILTSFAAYLAVSSADAAGQMETFSFEQS